MSGLWLHKTGRSCENRSNELGRIARRAARRVGVYFRS
jgi:hypothetical protein